MVLACLQIVDPWPGLTREILRELVGEPRRGKVSERGLDIVHWDAAGKWHGDWSKIDSTIPAPPLTLQKEICAAYNRDWLLDDADRKKAARAAQRRKAWMRAERDRKKAHRDAFCSSFLDLSALSPCAGTPGILGLRAVRSVAQPGSALDWGSRGRGFESRRSDQIKTRT